MGEGCRPVWGTRRVARGVGGSSVSAIAIRVSLLVPPGTVPDSESLAVGREGSTPFHQGLKPGAHSPGCRPPTLPASRCAVSSSSTHGVWSQKRISSGGSRGWRGSRSRCRRSEDGGAERTSLRARTSLPALLPGSEAAESGVGEGATPARCGNNVSASEGAS